MDKTCVHCGDEIGPDEGYELFVAENDDEGDEYYHEKCAVADGVCEDTGEYYDG